MDYPRLQSLSEGPAFSRTDGSTQPARTLTVDERYLQDMVEQAARKGAREALESIGLHDADAIHDVLELRGLLDAWRGAKRTAWKTITQAVTMAFLGALTAGAYMHFRGDR
jgi:hypothetical protein